MSYLVTAQRELPNYNYFSYEPASGALGATISGISLADDLPQPVVDELYAALLEFKVLFFHDQPLTDAQHLRLARKFGMPQGPGAIPQADGYPMIRRQKMDQYSSIGGDVNYHADDSFRHYPSRMSILRALDVPAGGGNTIWCDMEKAYHNLAEPMRAFLEGLTAEHTLVKNFGAGILEDGGAQAFEDMLKRNPPVVHPVVRKHPDTQRKCLWVNQLATSRIVELGEHESEAMLRMLFEHSYRPEHECRFFWRNNSVAIWDNRSTQHRGINDFSPAFRLMHRIPIIDDLMPSLTPEDQQPLEFDRNAEFIRVEDLFLEQPELSYGDAPAQAAPASESVTDEHAAVVDEKFYTKLNANSNGFSFTRGAAARVKQIPRLFRGAALSAIFEEAEKQDKQQVDLAVLDAVQAKRGR